jgi:23S rRNA (adenine2030-N6)-methyltransferase
MLFWVNLPMNYRHIYHAGCVCDVVKHSVLTLLLQRLRAKDKAFSVMDTQAGLGLYPIEDERAAKTNEAAAGFLRLMAASPVAGLEAYYDVLRALNPDGVGRHYPGSPYLTRQLLRPQDELIACELHPEDARELRHLFYNDPQVHVHERDAYEALAALFPPASGRGLAFIDPSYEERDEWARLTQALVAAHRRWPMGQFAVWYPIKERPALWRWHEDLIATGIPKILCAEFIYEPETRSDRLNGSGMILINPPWQFEETVNELFPALHKALATEYQGSIAKWLAGE